jgi:hypothetical protein
MLARLARGKSAPGVKVRGESASLFATGRAVVQVFLGGFRGALRGCGSSVNRADSFFAVPGFVGPTKLILPEAESRSRSR